ncbi:MAG: hypothetical protein WC619_02445 [Patescibacteria group bacterium]
MNRNLTLAIVGLIVALIFGGLKIASLIVDFLFGWIFSFTPIHGGMAQTSITILVLVLVSVACFAWYRGKNPKLVVAMLMALAQVFFVYCLYFGYLADVLVAQTGYGEREITFWLSVAIVPVVGIFWYLFLSLFMGTSGKMAIGYVILSVLMCSVIAGDMYCRPFDLFEHLPKKDANGKVLKDEAGNPVAESKFYILRNEEGRIIEVSHSEGISTRYGKPLVKGTPEDAAEVERFEEQNSKNLIFLKSLSSSSSSHSKQPTLVFEKPYTFADAFNEYGQIDTFKFVDDGVNVGDKVEVIAKPIDGGGFSGEEVGIWQGEKFFPPWDMTVKGYYFTIIESAPKGNIFMISLNSRKDLGVTIRVTRGNNLKS